MGRIIKAMMKLIDLIIYFCFQIDGYTDYQERQWAGGVATCPSASPGWRLN